MDQLIAGYQRFRVGHWGQHSSHYERLNARQEPTTCVISCCDSRVDPVAIFDAHPGDLFVIRNVANLVPPFRASDGVQGTSTAIEFAVRHLKVSLIIVLGHARCGGVHAAIDPKAVDDAVFLKQWINLLNDAKRRLPPALSENQDALEHESIRVSLERLRTFPFVAEAEAAGWLRLAGARFSIFDGKLEMLDEITGKFAAIEVGNLDMKTATDTLIARYYAAFNAKDVDGMLACLADDVVHDVNQGGRRKGKELFAAFLAHMNRCYREDLHELVVMASADGTRAAAEFVVHGTYLQTDEGLPPARGQKYNLPAAATFAVADGKISRVSTHYNLNDWMAQVG